MMDKFMTLLKKCDFFYSNYYISIEGFRIEALVSRMMSQGITMRRLKSVDDLEVRFYIKGSDYKKIQRFLGNQYQLTVLRRGGLQPYFLKLKRRTGLIAGFLIFCFMLLYQQAGIEEIRIQGFAKIPEVQIREALRREGLYEGCRKSNIDKEQLINSLYVAMDQVAWVNIKFEGALATVEIIESEKAEETEEDERPRHVIASKAAYIYDIHPIMGEETVRIGDYVNKGDVVITGAVDINSTVYSANIPEGTKRFVPAKGEVLGIVHYKWSYRIEPERLIKQPTNKTVTGFYLETSKGKISPLKGMLKLIDAGEELILKEKPGIFEVEYAQYNTRSLLTVKRPFSLALGLETLEKVEILSEELTEDQIETQVNLFVQHDIREKIKENVQILKKDLKFVREENIIEATVALETLESIGTTRLLTEEEMFQPQLENSENNINENH